MVVSRKLLEKFIYAKTSLVLQDSVPSAHHKHLPMQTGTVRGNLRPVSWICANKTLKVMPFVLSERPAGTNSFPQGHYLMPDTNAFLSGMDLFEQTGAFYDVIVL